MSKITVAAQLTGVRSRADRTWTLTFNTQEIGADAAGLMELLMDQGWLLFSPNDDLSAVDIPEVRADAQLSEKSPSQRLRDVLFVYYKQSKSTQPWETFYLSQMNRIIDIVKENLEPKEAN